MEDGARLRVSIPDALAAAGRYEYHGRYSAYSESGLEMVDVATCVTLRPDGTFEYSYSDSGSSESAGRYYNVSGKWQMQDASHVVISEIEEERPGCLIPGCALGTVFQWSRHHSLQWATDNPETEKPWLPDREGSMLYMGDMGENNLNRETTFSL